jgi:hypothetical protein
MARYFFHIRNGRTSLDEEGTELGGLDAVRDEALRTAGVCLVELGEEFWRHARWTMWVVDEAGVTVLRLNFSAGENP